jgi:phosphosulfolactate phosphohydrolase-like enzyme
VSVWLAVVNADGNADGDELVARRRAIKVRPGQSDPVIVLEGLRKGDKVVVYSSIGRTSLGGVSNLLIPILIAALIVMNTMMGAVYERFREIGLQPAGEEGAASLATRRCRLLS